MTKNTNKLSFLPSMYKEVHGRYKTQLSILQLEKFTIYKTEYLRIHFHVKDL